VADVHHPALDGSVRRDDRVVLILANPGTALRLKDTDHLERHFLYSDHLSYWVDRPKQIFYHGLAKDAHFRPIPQIQVRKESA